TNCATCDSRTINCAPFLISLSLSGQRKLRVSRESSVHSMISISSPLMKSMSPIEIVFLTLKVGGSQRGCQGEGRTSRSNRQDKTSLTMELQGEMSMAGGAIRMPTDAIISTCAELIQVGRFCSKEINAAPLPQRN